MGGRGSDYRSFATHPFELETVGSRYHNEVLLVADTTEKAQRLKASAKELNTKRRSFASASGFNEGPAFARH
jgi:hypothetical protein